MAKIVFFSRFSKESPRPPIDSRTEEIDAETGKEELSADVNRSRPATVQTKAQQKQVVVTTKLNCKRENPNTSPSPP
ncbi:uncharacterized protein A4U43_C07F31450 [Asparagus officinalis]|uniref:Uncharacterized protein n=1 Tax=Asparagus officinalis TaxID=4686 RepID=A0A5P1EI97_ASPOF|nr:uncharacterized protein A4U43_C07F31450 [Asparagus officinalis]